VTAKIRVMVVDDHHLVRAGFAALVDRAEDMCIVGEAADTEEAVAQHRALRPDVTLMDLRLPKGSGVEAITAIRAEAPQARFIVLTTYDGDDDVFGAVRAGARGYLLKGMRHHELLQAIRSVHGGALAIPAELAARASRRGLEADLSARETAVLGLIARGFSNREIAAELAIAEKTVKGHITHLLTKLGATARTEALVLAVQRGLIKLD
jgi:DNA-binding NarL/FixJ family response regulator